MSHSRTKIGKEKQQNARQRKEFDKYRNKLFCFRNNNKRKVKQKHNRNLLTTYNRKQTIAIFLNDLIENRVSMGIDRVSISGICYRLW